MENIPLIFKVLSGAASEPEQTQLENWIAHSQANKAEYEDIKGQWDTTGNTHQVNPTHFYDGLVRIKSRIKKKRAIRKRRRLTIRTCGIIMTILITTYVFISSQPAPHGVLRFDSAPLAEVIARLEKEFHIHIETNPEILGCSVTGTFYKRNDQQGLIRSLSAAMKLNYEILNDNVYRLSGSGCGTNRTEVTSDEQP